MLTGYSSLFIGSLLASTLIPGGVEALLYYMHASGNYSDLGLLSISTAGNTVGGIITYAMGYVLSKGLARTSWHQRIMRFFKLEEQALSRVQKWGMPTLLFSWLPVVGDPLCLAAGYLKLAFWPSAGMIFLGKLARYMVLIWIYAQPWATLPQ